MLLRPVKPLPDLALSIHGVCAVECFRSDSVEITSQLQVFEELYGITLEQLHTMSFNSGDSRFLLSLRFFNGPFCSILLRLRLPLAIQSSRFVEAFHHFIQPILKLPPLCVAPLNTIFLPVAGGFDLELEDSGRTIVVFPVP